jgi:hypothetical protein
MYWVAAYMQGHALGAALHCIPLQQQAMVQQKHKTDMSAAMRTNQDSYRAFMLHMLVFHLQWARNRPCSAGRLCPAAEGRLLHQRPDDLRCCKLPKILFQIDLVFLQCQVA